jgi:hypothetical protein
LTVTNHAISPSNIDGKDETVTQPSSDVHHNSLDAQRRQRRHTKRAAARQNANSTSVDTISVDHSHPSSSPDTSVQSSSSSSSSLQSVSFDTASSPSSTTSAAPSTPIIGTTVAATTTATAGRLLDRLVDLKSHGGVSVVDGVAKLPSVVRTSSSSPPSSTSNGAGHATKGSSDIDNERKNSSDAPITLIVLDGTWPMARMLNKRLTKLLVSHDPSLLVQRVTLTASSRLHFGIIHAPCHTLP